MRRDKVPVRAVAGTAFFGMLIAFASAYWLLRFTPGEANAEDDLKPCTRVVINVIHSSVHPPAPRYRGENTINISPVLYLVQFDTVTEYSD